MMNDDKNFRSKGFNQFRYHVRRRHSAYTILIDHCFLLIDNARLLADEQFLPRPTISLDSDLRNYNAGGSRYVQRNEGGIRNREGSP